MTNAINTKQNSFAIYEIMHYSSSNSDESIEQKKSKTKYQKYDRDGKVIEYKRWSKSGKLSSWDKRYYNKNSQFDSVVSFFENGQKKSKNLYYYNLGNKIDSVKVFSNDKKLISEQFNEYYNRKLISLSNNYVKHNTNIRTIYTYNKKGFLKSSKVYSNKKYYGSQFDYFRDNKGKVLIEVFKKDNRIVKKYFKYDKNDNIIESKNLDSKNEYPEIYTYKFSYDHNENWISRITYLNGKLYLKEERIINYY